jgi:hypothetical protein
VSKKPNEPPKKRKSQTPKDITIPLSERPTFSINEFCSWIGFGRSSFYSAVKRGEIKLCKFGKRSFIKREEALRFIAKMS